MNERPAAPRDLRLGVAAVAQLLLRPATDLQDLATRLGAPPHRVAAGLRAPSVAPLVMRGPRGELRAACGATSATLPRARRRALAPLDGARARARR